MFFLTAGTIFGWWLFLAPALYGIGNWVMYKTYTRINELGYFKESKDFRGATGLVPYIGQRLTGSRGIGWLLVLLSALNLLAVIVLELTIGVEVIGYLTKPTLK